MTLYFDLTTNLGRQLTRSFSPQNRWLKVGGIALLTLYVTSVLFSLGFLFSETLRRWIPEQDSVFLLHQYLLVIFLTLFSARLAFQRSPRVDIAKYLHLPVSRWRLVTFFQLSSLLNVHTLLPLLFFFPFWLRYLVWPAWPGDQPGVWLAGVLLMLLFSHYMLLTVRTLSGRASRVLLIATAAVALAVALQIIPGAQWVRATSLMMFGGLRRGDLAILGMMMVLTIAAFAGSSMLVHGRLTREEARAGSPWFAGRVAFSARFGKVFNLFLMECQLIWRNARPRSVFNYSLLFGTAPIVLLLLNPGNTQVLVLAALTALLASGSFAINYGQLMFSWESRYFDGFLMRQHEPGHMVSAKMALLQISCLAFYVITLPFFLGLAPQLAMMHLAFMLYNAGVNSPMLLAFALQNEKRVNIQRAGVTNYEGFAMRHLLLFIPTMLPPLVLLHVMRHNPSGAVLALGAAGAAGLLLTTAWSSLLARGLERRKYAMAYGFKRYDY